VTNGEVALFRIGVDPRGVRAKKVCDFINYWTTTDLELDLAIRRYCRLYEVDEVALKQAVYWVKEKAIANNDLIAQLFKSMSCDEFIIVLTNISIN
jgi:hypothetical protein